MKKTLKRSLAALLGILLAFTAFAPAAFATDGGTEGSLTWSYDPDAGVLTIGGSGAMKDYGFTSPRPAWDAYKDEATAVVIGKGVTHVGNFAFYYFSALEAADIPDGVTSVGDSAFSGCGALKAVRLPDSVTSVDEYAFASCDSLEEAVLSNKLTAIGKSTFESCRSLKSVTVPGSVESVGNQAFLGCSKLESVTILPGTESLGLYAFGDCSALEKVFIPASVQKIGSYAFAGSDLLKTVYYGGSEEQWNAVQQEKTTFWMPEDGWYRARTEEEALTFRYNSNIAGNIIWSYDDATATLYIDGTGAVSDYDTNSHRPEWYDYKDRAKAIVIGSGITKIGDFAFYGFSAAETVCIPDSVTAIRYWAFRDCASLQAVTIPDSVTTVSIGAFAYCTSLEEAVISNNITEIIGSMFEGCSSLKHVTVPGSAEIIDSQAFSLCTSLETVTIRSGVKTISCYAFRDCNLLKSVVIPESVQTIDMYAFGGCDALEAVYYCGSKARWDAVQTDETAFTLSDLSNHWYRLRTEEEPLNVVFYWGVQGTIYAIEDIGAVEYTAACKARIDEARKAYDRLSDHESTLVENYGTLKAAEAEYARLQAEAEKPLPGDVTGDGEITAEDARLALRAAVKLEDFWDKPDSAPFIAADADKDGSLTAADARKILRAAVKLEDLSAA